MTEEKIQSLKKRMNDIGCVFEFLVLVPEADARIDEINHRQILNELYKQIAAEELIKHEKVKNQFHGAIFKPFEYSWNLHKAKPKLLSHADIQKLIHPYITRNHGMPLALYNAFCNTPHGINYTKVEPELEALFLEWIGILGLEDDETVQVFNWVDDLNLGKIDNHSWSNYFDAGLEWWGAWCLTIWNPRRRTLSALVASTTD